MISWTPPRCCFVLHVFRWPLFQEQQVSCSLLKLPGTERAPLAGCLIVISESAHLHLILIWFDLTSD